MTAALRRSFSSLSIPNYRRYYTGQVVSVSGNWMQIVAETWLVIKLTNSGVAVGIASALQFLPMLVLGAYGGVIADRFDKRRILLITQPLMAIPAITLWALVAGGAVQAWMVIALIFTRGLVTAFDNPARQSFVSELVGPDQVVNAISLNGVMVSTSRIVGPAIAAGIIATVGVGPCFLVNAATFGVMVIVLRRLEISQLRPVARSAKARGQIRDVLRVVRSRADLWVPLALMAVVGTFSYNFLVVLPLLAKFTWHGGATTYAALLGAMAVGSVAGGLTSAHRGRVSPALLVGAAGLLGVFELCVSVAPDLPAQLLLLVPMGVVSATFVAATNSSLQIAAEGPLRGRVMSLFGIVFLGSTPIGSPIVGWLSQVASPRWGMAIGGVAGLIAAAGAAAAYRRAAARAGATRESGVPGVRANVGA
jgi:MFS family permease